MLNLRKHPTTGDDSENLSYLSQGSLDKYPVGSLLADIWRHKLTGILDLDVDRVYRRIYVRDGHPIFMQSNADWENVGVLLLQRGRISHEEYIFCRQVMSAKQQTLQQVLLGLGLVEKPELLAAHKLLSGHLLPQAIGLHRGTYTWQAGDAFVGQVPTGNYCSLGVIFDGSCRYVKPTQIGRFFRGFEDQKICLCSHVYEDCSTVKELLPNSEHLFQLLRRGSSYREICDDDRIEICDALPKLFAMVTSGMARLSAETTSYVISEQTSQRAFDWSIVDKKYKEVMSKNFLEILNLEQQSSEKQISSKYYQTLNNCFKNASLGTNIVLSSEKTKRIYARIDEAYYTMVNPSKRQKYLKLLDRQARGLSIDLKDIQKAETFFRQALELSRKKQLQLAQIVLKKAIVLNPEPLYQAHFGWMLFVQSPKKAKQAIRYIKNAITRQKSLTLGYQFLGAIYLHLGRVAQARRWWRLCLTNDPNNIAASQGLATAKQLEAEGYGYWGPLRGLRSFTRYLFLGDSRFDAHPNL